MGSGKFWGLAIFALSAMTIGNAMADGFGCAASSPAGTIACLQSRDAILSRELAVAAKEKALRKLGDADLRRHLSLPLVESTYGSPGRLKAVLYWRDGSSLSVSSGDVIPGGYRVVAVSPGRVTVSGRNGGNHVLLMEGGPGGAGGDGYSGNGTGQDIPAAPAAIPAPITKPSLGGSVHDEP